MAAEVRDSYPNADIRTIRSGGGRFEVTVDGVPVFEKSKLGRFPNTGEILQLIAARKA